MKKAGILGTIAAILGIIGGTLTIMDKVPFVWRSVYEKDREEYRELKKDLKEDINYLRSELNKRR